MKYQNVILVAIFLLVSIFIVKLYYSDITEKREHPSTNELAVDADEMFAAASFYLHEDYRLTSIDYLNKAIKAMRLVEKDVDPESNEAIEKAIRDLEFVEKEIKNNIEARPHLEKAFVSALNSLAIAQLRVSEKYLKSGEYSKSQFALSYADQHLKNAMLYSSERSKQLEGDMYKIIDQMIRADSVSPEQMRLLMDSVITGLDSLIKR